MKFREQLKILLWKNWTLKKRSPVLTVFEIVIPMILMAILAILRNSIAVTPKGPDYGSAMPLPTAGLIPLAQMFCDGGTVDNDHFVGQPGSFLDISLFLANSITKIADGEWPPEKNAKTFTKYLQDIMRTNNKESFDLRSIWKENKFKFLTFLSQEEKLIEKHPTTMADIFKKISELKAARQKMERIINDRNSYQTFENTTLPDQCNRFVLSQSSLKAKGYKKTGRETQEDTVDYFEIFMAIWQGLEVAVCQNPRPRPDPNWTRELRLGGARRSELDDIPIGDIIMRALQSNPRILYSPSGTDADKIIQSIYGLDFIADTRMWAETWLQLSTLIREDLNLTVHATNTKLESWLSNMKDEYDMVTDVTGDPGVTETITEDPEPPFTWPPLPTLAPGTLRQLLEDILDAIDYGSCMWLGITDVDLDVEFFVGFPSEEEMVQYFLNGTLEDKVTVIASIAFEMGENGTIPPHMTYKIRQNATISQTTTQIQDLIWTPGSDWRGLFYIFNGFIWLQDIIERSIIDNMVGEQITEPGLYIQEFPIPCYIEDTIKLILVEHMFPLVLVFSNVFSVALLARGIVYEKERRLKEMMKLMGLEGTVHWAAWFITAAIQMTIIMTLLTILISLAGILPYTEGFLLWMLLTNFGINTVLFSFFMSTLFNEARIASACAGIFYLLTYVPYMVISILENGGFTQPLALKVVFSFFTTTGMGLSGRYFNFFETVGQGVTFGNFLTSMTAGEDYDLFVATLMSLLSSFTYIILIWYIDNVFPGEYGIPRPWYFPLTVTYWCGGPAVEDTETGCHNKLPSWMKRLLISLGCISMSRMVEDLLKKSAKTESDRDPRYFEPEPTDLPVAATIQNMTKVFSNGKLAVDDLSLTMYEGQILSFLGHNGAGKTTTMSMLTGMIPPSTGTALIYGRDIRHEMVSIRKSLGMCPQHNVLFESMTVEEHLKFYARLKGTPKHGLDLEVESMLDDTGLREKRFNTVDALSGGMKRKLCIGMAFISGSRTVILDEPTAGVDPWSRREIWDLILKYKQERTIMLSTHHMDEADILGDIIAVISHGSLKCKGSSLFLKSTFGEGYHLVAAKKITKPTIPALLRMNSNGSDRERSPSLASNMSVFESEKDTASVDTKCQEKHVSLFIRAIVSDAYLKNETPRELHYIVPYSAIKSGKASDLFLKLDRSLSHLELDSYGVSDTSLEEVFLRVTAYAKSRPNTSEALGDMTAAAPAMQSQGMAVHDDPFEDTVMPPVLQRYHSMPARRTSIDVTDGYYYVDKDILFQRLIDKAIEQGNMSGMTMEDSNGRVFTPENFVKAHGRNLSDMADLKMEARRRRSSALRDQTPQTMKKLRRSMSATPAGTYPDRGTLSSTSSLTGSDTDNIGSVDDLVKEDKCRGAAGSYVVTGWRQVLNQFITCILKRLFFTIRNWKALVSQVVLPVIFVTVAMLIGVIGGPKVREESPLELSTAMFFNQTKAMGNHFVPFSDHQAYAWSYNAPPLDLIKTFLEPSGIGATCVISSPEWNENGTYEYSDSCDKVLWKDGRPIHPWVLDDYNPTPPPNNSQKRPSQTEEVAHYYPYCQCTMDDRMLVCEDDPALKSPPSFKVITQDILLNITGVDETEYFYAMTEKYRTSRFGATTFGHVRSQVPYWLVQLPSALKHMFKARVAKAWYDTRGWHSVPVFINAVNNAILRANLPKEKGNPAAYGITVINQPMNGTTTLNAVGSLIFGAEFIIAVMVVVGFSFIPAGFILFLVQERSSKAKHLQFVSGLNPLVYWIANLVWDMVLYLLPVAFCALILRLFNLPAFTEGINYSATMLLLLVFGWSCTPIMYPASFLFKESSSAYVTLAIINILLGVALLFVTFLLDYFQDQEDLIILQYYFDNAFVIFPTYALGRGLMDIVLTNTINDVNELIGVEERKSPYDFDVTGRNLTAMACMGVFCFTLTLLIEYNFFIKPKVMPVEEMTPVGKEDGDVAAERQRVLKGRAKREVVRLSNLTKIYKTAKLGKHIAVHRLCLGIPKGECFGMLGVNGAGKTTTFKMLTGDHNPSGGDAFICGYSILRNQNKVRQKMGYCPQFDALFDELTARQHLKLYARLRGVPSKELDDVVEWALDKLELQMYADKPAGTYSGGNKRKLSTAIALLGNPPVVFLDEPTAGMDPYAKRFLWDLILDLVDEGKCIILTSHSMEECETLCGRLAIMVQGRFRCLGSVQHLKSHYGDGYGVKVTVPGPDYDSDMKDFILFMNKNFPNATIKERHYNLLEYEFRPEKESLASVFKGLETAKSNALILDYSISQNTLDNVFINFVKEQQENYESRVGPVVRSRRVRPLSSIALELDSLTTPLLQDPECRNDFTSNVLNLDELEALGTRIHLYTPV